MKRSRHGGAALALALVVSGLGRGAPAPTEERFFDWTHLQFDAAVHRQRRERLMHEMRGSGGGVFLAPSRYSRSHGETFRQQNDFLYFTGLELPDSVLVVDADEAKTVVFVPARDPRFDAPSRPNDFPGRPLLGDPDLARMPGLADVRPITGLEETVATWVRDGRALWVNPETPDPIPAYETGFVQHQNQGQSLAFHLQRAFPGAELRNAYRALARLRMIKGPEEIDVLRRGCDLTARAIEEAANAIRDGIDERHLEGVLEAAFKRGGGQRVAFDSIIKSGPNALWPWRILASHYDRRNRTMHDGEVVVLDVGTELDHYVTDVGRTFPVSGEFTEEQRRTLEMVTSVADGMIAAVKPGVTHAEVIEAGRNKMPPAERKYMQPEAFNGHHIGLSLADPVAMDTELAPGMVFTVEPTYYNHDEPIAVFIEDVVLVTENGAEILTDRLSRSAEALESLVGNR